MADHVVKDLSLADWGRKEIEIAETEMPGLMALRAEFGDRLPVVLLDGREHSYWELDEPRLRKDLASG